MIVLAVDDEPGALALMKRVLETSGFTVLAAASAAEAVRAFNAAQGQVDLLVTDVVMPEVDGPTLAEQLRRLKPGLRVLFVSGFLAQYESLGHGDRGAGLRFLAKPFSPSVLIGEVKKTLAAGRKRC